MSAIPTSLPPGIPPNPLSVKPPGSTPGAAPAANGAKNTPPPASANPLLPGSAASPPDVRQILSQIMVILQSLMSSLGKGGAPAIGADATGAGNAANCPLAGAAGGASPASLALPVPAAKPPAPAPVPVAAPAPPPPPPPAPVPPAAPTAAPNIGLGGFAGVSNLTISGLPPAPNLPPAPTSFFTPIAMPAAAPAPAPVAPAPGAAPPAAKIPLTSGEELQQRIQNFNRANPNNLQGLAQFLTNSYSNTTPFTLQPDGKLLYGVSGKTFVIDSSGLTPRQEVPTPGAAPVA
jgi:hypothetical protein